VALFYFGIEFIEKVSTHNDKGLYLIIMTAVALVMAVYHLFYNNLLINLRFRFKMRCLTLGKFCMYDALNYLFCSCFLHKICRDRCFTLPTGIKWVVYCAYFWTFAVFVFLWKKQALEDINESIDNDEYLE